jgi:hypothetical protein
MSVISLPPEEREISLGIHEYISLDEILTQVSRPEYLFRGNSGGYPLPVDIYPRSFIPPDGLEWTRFEKRDRLIFKENIYDKIYYSAGDFYSVRSYGSFFPWDYETPEPELDEPPIFTSPWQERPFQDIDYPLDESSPGSIYTRYLREGIRLYTLTAEYFRSDPRPTATLNLNKPNYKSLVSGYFLDNRSIPNFPQIVSPIDKTIEISYYRWNRLENIPNLKSICWMVYKCQLIKDVPYVLPIEDCVLGTLNCSNAAALALITGLPNTGDKYRWSDLTFAAIPSLFTNWYALYDATNTNPDDLPIFPEIRLLRKIAANNDIWNNANLGVDINPDPAHPMFAIDEELAYFNHLMPTVDGIGNLTMEGPHTKEIHAALNAGFYARDPATNRPRVANLGWRIERGNEVLGIRVKADGTIDEDLEKTTNRRIHADGSDSNNIQEFNPNCFGKKGMLLRRLPNKFSRDGTVPGGYAKVRDLPQMMAELHEQANAAMGYQEGTAIEIKLDGETYRYPNQLALLTELFVTAKQTATYSKGTFFSSIVAEQSIKEVMAGLGLRTVDKFLEFKVGKKAAKLYYKGVSASQSVGRQLSAISTNIGMIIGNII